MSLLKSFRFNFPSYPIDTVCYHSGDCCTLYPEILDYNSNELLKQQRVKLKQLKNQKRMSTSNNNSNNIEKEKEKEFKITITNEIKKEENKEENKIKLKDIKLNDSKSKDSKLKDSKSKSAKDKDKIDIKKDDTPDPLISYQPKAKQELEPNRRSSGKKMFAFNANNITTLDISNDKLLALPLPLPISTDDLANKLANNLNIENIKLDNMSINTDINFNFSFGLEDNFFTNPMNDSSNSTLSHDILKRSLDDLAQNASISNSLADSDDLSIKNMDTSRSNGELDSMSSNSKLNSLGDAFLLDTSIVGKSKNKIKVINALNIAALSPKHSRKPSAAVVAASDVKLSPRLLAKEVDIEVAPLMLERLHTFNSSGSGTGIINDEESTSISRPVFESNNPHNMSAFSALTDAPTEMQEIDEMTPYSFFYQLALNSPFGVKYPAKKLKSSFSLKRHLPNTSNGLDHSLWSIQGCRDHMEDRHRVLYDFGVELSNGTDSSPVMVNGFFGVFDGHSGWIASQYAAQFLPDCIFAHLQRAHLDSASKSIPNSNLPICMSRAYDQLEFEILRHSAENKHDAGSTAVCAVVVDGSIYCANTGDSRCVLARRLPINADCDNHTRTFLPESSTPFPPKAGPGIPLGPPIAFKNPKKNWDAQGFLNSFTPPIATDYDGEFPDESEFILNAIDLSSDHKPSRPDERERIYEVGGSVSSNSHIEKVCGVFSKSVEGPLRVRPGNLSLSRTLGDLSNKLPGECEVIIHDCEVSITRVDSSCLFMIFGSDGLWDVISSQDAVDYVYRKITVHKVPHREVARKLVQRALDIGSKDNITALIVFFSHW